MPNEPSMEEILSSIKRIIAEDDAEKPASRPVRRTAKNGAQLRAVATPSADEQILELTNALPDDSLEEADMRELAMRTPAGPTASDPPHHESNDDDDAGRKGKSEASAAAPPKPNARAQTSAAQAPTAPTTSPVLSDISAQAARESLTHLSRLLIRPEDGQSNTLEGLVRELLRPMLKEWLDANLPDMVETLVKREIDRITGRV